MQGEVPALCTQAGGAVKCPGGKLGRGRGAGRSPLTCRRGSEGRQEPSDPRGRLQRQAACSPCGSLVSRVRRSPARSEVPGGHGTNGCQGTRGSPVHQDRPSTTVHRWSPRRRRHRVQLEKERSESTLKKKQKQNKTVIEQRRGTVCKPAWEEVLLSGHSPPCGEALSPFPQSSSLPCFRRGHR